MLIRCARAFRFRKQGTADSSKIGTGAAKHRATATEDPGTVGSSRKHRTPSKEASGLK